MEGRLTVSSREGEGSTFVLELPRVHARSAGRAAAVARQA